MRPLKLIVEGFTCFRTAQELDFSKLDLFAMSGPTGAGKSSILEAMTYALYGRLPRIDAVTELISQGSDRMRVTFEFALENREYRILRSLRRKGPAPVQLDETTGGTEELRASGAREVNQVVERMIGLSYTGFVQAVVLPQGEFSRFLKSAPGERRALLTQLLSLELYGDMQKRANESAKECEGRMGELSSFLDTEYAGATDEGLEGTKKGLADARALEKELKGHADAARQSHDRAKHAHALTKELLQKERALRALEDAAPEHRRDEGALAAARRAEPVNPFNVRLEDERLRLKEFEDAVVRAQVSEGQAARALSDAEKAVASAKKGAVELSALTERVEGMEKALAEFPHVARARARATKDEAERDRLDEAHSDQLELLKELQASERELLKRRAAAEKKMQGSGHDAEALKRLVAASKKATQLRRERETATDRSEAADEARRHVDDAVAAAAGGRAKAERASADLEKCVAAVEAARTEEERLRRLHAAAHLRGTLSEGDECPVCEQRVAKVPRPQKVANVDDNPSRLEAAESKRFEAQSKADRLRTTLEHAEKAVEERTDALALARASEKKASEAFVRTEAALRTEVKELVTTGAQALEDRVDRALEEAQNAEDVHEELSQALREADRDHGKALQKAEAAKEKASDLEQRRKDAREVATASRDESTKLEVKLRKLMGNDEDPDPDELEQLRERRDAIEEARRTANEQHAKADKTHGVAEAKLKTARTQVETAQERVAATEEKGQLAAKQAGFRSFKEACSALLEPQVRTAIEERIKKWVAGRAGAQERIAALGKELGEERVTASDLEAAEEVESKAAQAASDAQDRVVQFAQETKQLAEKLEKAKVMREDLKKLEHQRSVWHGLGQALRSDGFLNWMLEGTFRRLVADASVRLQQMSAGRYTFELRADNSFDVLDEENARERRAVATLSGGETFLASLALALALSEQVQGSGTTRLESLFIDEGFGSLDPQSLDTAISAIESLHTGGRMVGVISHIETLGDRLTQRVIVEKRADGSRLRVES